MIPKYWLLNRILLFPVIILVVGWSGSTKAQPQGSCYDILRNGAFRRIQALTVHNYSGKLQTAFCSYLRTAKNDNSGFSLGALIPVEGVPVQFLGGYDSSSHQAMMQQYCQSSNQKIDEHKLQEVLIQIADPGIVTAWQACMADANNAPLISAQIWGRDEREFSIRVRWGGAGGVHTVKVANFTATNAKCSPQVIKKNATITTGWVGQPCVRNGDGSKPVQISLNVVDAKKALNSSPLANFTDLLPAVSPVPSPTPAPIIKVKTPIYVGVTPGCNAGIAALNDFHLNCTNLPIGNLIEEGPASNQKLYVGITPNVNAGVITTKPNFKGGATIEIGFTVKDAFKQPNSIPLYVVAGCGNNDGEVTTTPWHKHCNVAPNSVIPIGSTYP